MSAKEELQRLVDLLSDYECENLLGTVRKVTVGERFWETDISILYNEQVKTRSTGISPSSASTIPTIPATEEGLFLPIPIVKAYKSVPRIELPLPGYPDISLTKTILRRRSRREYNGKAISLHQLSTLLQLACGTTGFLPGYDYDRLPLRTFPSAGGLQSPEVYLSVQAVTGVPSGLYHYHLVDHALECLSPGDHSLTLSTLALGQPYLDAAAVVILISGYYERVRWKYGERAYRYMCMDAGFLAENLYLAAEALELGACAIAGFVDDAVERFLGIDGQDEMALLLVSVGVTDEVTPLAAPTTPA
jgi:SagB-type dehydrogenase family enzyme